MPFQGRDTYQDVLKTIARLSRTVETVDGRKVIVCIGSAAVCDIAEPGEGSYSMIWREWVDAMRAAARGERQRLLCRSNRR